ncbi:hypothetical protein BCT35_18860 [Vibrio lentus]|nr:hypothetical protein BCU96_16815 [Vibrio lentus]PMH13448.1 hypothetical protein BCU76_19730 [Vibrio lentus]PMI40013.1 hypothetical protein BCU45_23030 [Vibrio lentus]PMI64225.1 hypothetical protein BCU40_20165 [Vibrio lentus]PMJ08695.1 hypothetical protein BCU30_24170 [Vibrio lentus]
MWARYLEQSAIWFFSWKLKILATFLDTFSLMITFVFRCVSIFVFIMNKKARTHEYGLFFGCVIGF